MKKLLVLLLLVSTISFAQEPIVGTWNFGLVNKINVKELINDANALGAHFKEEDIKFVYAVTAVYVMGRCENSEMIVSDFENNVLITIKNPYDPKTEHMYWGKWEKIGDNLYKIIMESGGEETYVVNEIDGSITLADAKYQKKIITKLLANNLKLIKKGN